MPVIAVANQKGGVGKTATVGALGAGFHRAGKRVLYIDCDSQCNITMQLGLSKHEPVTLYDVLEAHRSPLDAIQSTEQGDIIPGSPQLAERDILTRRGAENSLQEAIAPVKESYDYILLDCPPALGSVTIAALMAADGVVIPCKADRFSMDALAEITGTIATVQEHQRPDLQIYGIIITMFDKRTSAHRLLLEEIQELADSLQIPVLTPPIRKAIAVEEVQLGGSIFDSRSRAAEDYQRIIDQMLSSTNSGRTPKKSGKKTKK